jgi:hypothetical protein
MQDAVAREPAKDFDEAVLVAVENQFAVDGLPQEQGFQRGTIGWIQKDFQVA